MKKIKNFFKGIKKETKAVRWPDGKSLLKNSVISVSLLIFFGLFFYALDALLGFVIGRIS